VDSRRNHPGRNTKSTSGDRGLRVATPKGHKPCLALWSHPVQQPRLASVSLNCRFCIMLERTRKPFCRVSSLLVRISVHGVGKPRPMHVLPHGLRKREDLGTWNSCTPFVYAETGWIATAGRCYYVLDCRMTIASLVCCNLRPSSSRLRSTYSVVKLEAA
jgi:hypothetical protein